MSKANIGSVVALLEEDGVVNLRAGHGCVLHVSNCWCSPTQVLPLWHALSLVLVPLPHELLHPDHTLQEPHVGAGRRESREH